MAKEKTEPLFSEDKIAAKRYEMLFNLAEMLTAAKDAVLELGIHSHRRYREYAKMFLAFNQWYSEFRDTTLAGVNDDLVVKVLQKEAKGAKGKDD